MWYGWAMDLMDAFLDDSDMPAVDGELWMDEGLAVELLTGFLVHSVDEATGKRLFSHCVEDLPHGELTPEEILKLGKYADNPLWSIDFLCEEARDCDYETIINIALAIGRYGEMDTANALLIELRSEQADLAVDLNLEMRLREEGWPVAAVFG